MNDDEFPIKPTKDHVVGGDLHQLSVDDLLSLSQKLKDEQIRIALEIEKKRSQNELAENLFKT